MVTITSRLIIQNQATPYSLAHLIHKPIVRLQNTLPAQIIENTPTDDPGTDHHHTESYWRNFIMCLYC